METADISFIGALVFWLALFIVIAWTATWKGLALWHSARRDHRWWFVAFIVISTPGILEIIYLFFIARIWDKPKGVAATQAIPPPPQPISIAAAPSSPAPTSIDTTSTTTSPTSNPASSSNTQN